MYIKQLTKPLLGVLMFASSTWTSCLADTDSISQLNEDLTSEALVLFEKGLLNDAMVVAQKAAEQSPAKWQAHATLAHLSWKQGDIVLALKEAELASSLAPSNPKLLENLARMNEVLGDFSTAGAVYKQMMSVSNSSAAGVGLARCMARLPDKKQEAILTLAEMASAPAKDSTWYMQIADTYLQLGESKLAWQTASKATKRAKNSEQEQQSRSLLLFALLRDNQEKAAASLADLVFSKNCDSKSCELFVLASQKLLNPEDTSRALRILNCAEKNLTSRDDADAFFRIGRLFQENASRCSGQQKKYDAWVNLAQEAYARATKLEPEQGRYHLALASTIARQGQIDRFVDELNKAKTFDQFDSLAPFFLSCLSAQRDSKTDIANQMRLTKVAFKLKGVNCSCHLSKVERTLAEQSSVAFACIRRPEYSSNPFNSESENKAQEYEGTLFVHEPSTPIEEIFSRCSKEFFLQPKQKGSFEFEMVGSVPLNGIEEAVRIAHNSKYPDPAHFINQIRVIEPTFPVDKVKQASKSTSARF